MRFMPPEWGYGIVLQFDGSWLNQVCASPIHR